jgi:hypothetical protein
MKFMCKIQVIKQSLKDYDYGVCAGGVEAPPPPPPLDDDATAMITMAITPAAIPPIATGLKPTVPPSPAFPPSAVSDPAC